MDAKAQDREGGNVAYALDELAKSSPPETMTRTFTHEYKHTEKRGTPGTQPCGLDVQQETVESKSPYPH
ncbi:hypothetical protein HBH45_183970 [Parastagonospora nodorum]|nr:hypothetical protein HBH45_183970 [Parastagonospora nodorum]